MKLALSRFIKQKFPRNWFRVQSVHGKISVLLLAIMLTIFGTVGTFVYLTVSSVIKNKIIESETLYMDEVAESLEDNLLRNIYTLELLFDNDDVRSTLQSPQSQFSYFQTRSLSNIFARFLEFNKNISSVVISNGSDNFIYPRDKDNIDIGRLQQTVSLRKGRPDATNINFISDITVYNPGRRSGGELKIATIKPYQNGFLVIVQNDAFPDSNPNYHFFLLDEPNRQILFQHPPGKQLTRFTNKELHQLILERRSGQNHTGANTVYIYKKYLRHLALNFVCIIPMDKIESELNSIARFIVLTFFFGLLIFWVINIFVSQEVIKPLKKLRRLIDALNLNSKHTGVFFQKDKSFFSRLFHKLDFKKKIYWMFSVCTIFPFILITIFIYNRTTRIILDRINANVIQAVNISAARINDLTDTYQRKIRYLIIKPELQEYLTGAKYDDPYQISRIQRIIGDTLINNRIANSGVVNVNLYDKNQYLIYSYLTNHPEKEAKHELIRVAKSYGRPIWTSARWNSLGQNTYSVSWEIRGYRIGKENGRRIGYITVILDLNAIENLFNTSLKGRLGNNLYIVDDEGQLVYGTGRGQETVVNKNAYRPIRFGEHLYYSSKDGKTFMYTASIGNTSWRILVPVSKGDIFNDTHQLFLNILYLLVFCIIAIHYISQKIAQLLVTRLARLEQVINDAEAGDLSKRYQDGTGDEIERLGESFNQMLLRIDALIQEVAAARIKEKEMEAQKNLAELKSLHAQINPHFLYNTLESINSLALIKGANEISRMAVALANMFRFSIKKGGEFVKFRDELDHVENYLKIQKIRYIELFDYIIEIDPAIYQFSCPKLILQPIVENAIYHGIEDSDKAGKLVITGMIHDGRIKIIIFDNGVGIDPAKLAEINWSLDNDMENTRNDSIGLANVNKRIKLYYGNDFGLKVSSIKGTETTVEINLPCQR